MEARRRHWANAGAHSGQFCTLCDCLIPSYEDLATHQSERHWPCQGCNLVFAAEEARDRHGQQDHPWCHTHRRAFRSQANYEAVSRIEGRDYRGCGCADSETEKSSWIAHALFCARRASSAMPVRLWPQFRRPLIRRATPRSRHVLVRRHPRNGRPVPPYARPQSLHHDWTPSAIDRRPRAGHARPNGRTATAGARTCAFCASMALRPCAA